MPLWFLARGERAAVDASFFILELESLMASEGALVVNCGLFSNP